ncbi:hypothetical protein CRE_02706 [Caenorhabditis remanei]|uniref:Serpentine receptor class r-10 n=1 Tax=Caenorhabditis remanei TaxID=31234 RepID=E3NMI1_CAERE|nr:hypothetical protein CRE_02706 [Caenorhabditis remanei]
MDGWKWRTSQHYFHFVSTSLSIILNLLLICLVKSRSPRTMGTYKYLLIGVSVFEIFYSSIEIIVSPIVHSFHTVVVVMTIVKDTWIPKSVMLILTATYCGSFGCFLAFFGILFIYRYYVISGNPNIKYFDSWNMIFWIIITLLCGSIWGAIGFFTLSQNSEIDEFIRSDLYTELNLFPEDITYLAPHFYLKDKNGEKMLNWKSIAGMNGVSLIVGVTCFFIIRYGLKTYKCIKHFSTIQKFSDRSKMIQKQLFYALVIQSSIPFLFLQLPLTILFICGVLDIHLGQLGGIDTFSISLFPVFDPLPTIFVIRAYRVAVLGKIHCWLLYSM